MNDSVIFRSADAQDMNFISSSWSESYRTARREKGVDSDIYFPEYRKKIARICRASTVMIMCLRENHDTVIGYGVFRDKGDVRILSYIYVKVAYRKQGYMKHLLKEIGKVDIWTHITPLFESYYDPKSKKYLSQMPVTAVYFPYEDDKI